MNIHTKLVYSLTLCILCLSHCVPIASVSFGDPVAKGGKSGDVNTSKNESRGKETSAAKKESALEQEHAFQKNQKIESQSKDVQVKQNSLDKQVEQHDKNSHTPTTDSFNQEIDLTSFTQDVKVQTSSESLFSDSARLKSESFDSVDSYDVFDVFSDTSIKSTESTQNTMQKPEDSVANVMRTSLPEGQKMMTMGRREDGSNYMISAKVEDISEVNSKKSSSKKPKIKTMHILEFDQHGQPLKDSKGQIQTTSLDIQGYRDQLSASRKVLLQKAEQELAEFKNADNLQKQTETYKKQQDAYNKAKAIRDNLEEVVQSDPSVQDAYQQAEKNLDIARNQWTQEDPQAIITRMENNIIKHSDKATRVADVKNKLDQARQDTLDNNNKITTLQKEYDNEKDSGKRSQLRDELQGAKNSKVFKDEAVTQLEERLKTTQKSSDSVDQGDFKSIFDDITSEFVKDPQIMESLKDNADYQDYKEQVTKKIYKPTMVESTMSGINSLATFMADADLGKAFKVKTPNPSKFFKSLAQDVKYAFKNAK